MQWKFGGRGERGRGTCVWGLPFDFAQGERERRRPEERTSVERARYVGERNGVEASGCASIPPVDYAVTAPCPFVLSEVEAPALGACPSTSLRANGGEEGAWVGELGGLHHRAGRPLP